MCWISWFRTDAISMPPKASARKLLKGLIYVPRVIITDKLASYGAAKREILPGVEHRQHKRLNHRAENAHQPTRLRERENAEIHIGRSCRAFFSRPLVPSPVMRQPRRHRLSAGEYRATFHCRFQVWNAGDRSEKSSVAQQHLLPNFSSFPSLVLLVRKALLFSR